MRTAVEGSPAAQMHPAVQQAIGLNAPMPAVQMDRAPEPPAQGVPLPPGAQPAASPAAPPPPPAYGGTPAAGYANEPEPAPRGLPQGTTNNGVDNGAPGPNVNPQPGPNGGVGVTNPGHQQTQTQAQSNYADDPILALVKQQMAQQDSASASNYLAQLQQMLLGYGSRSLAQDVFTKLGSDNSFQNALGSDLWGAFQGGQSQFLNQVDANGNIDTGLGTVAQLAYKNRNDQHVQDEGYNQGNLFFSGAHGNAVSQLARNYAIEGSNAQQGLLGQLAGIRTGLLGDLSAHQGTLVNSENEAYTRAVDEALKYGTGDSGATGGNDTPAKKKDDTPAASKPAPPPMAGPPDDRARKGANPPGPAPAKKKAAATPYRGPH